MVFNKQATNEGRCYVLAHGVAARCPLRLNWTGWNFHDTPRKRPRLSVKEKTHITKLASLKVWTRVVSIREQILIKTNSIGTSFGYKWNLWIWWSFIQIVLPRVERSPSKRGKHLTILYGTRYPSLVRHKLCSKIWIVKMSLGQGQPWSFTRPRAKSLYEYISLRGITVTRRNICSSRNLCGLNGVSVFVVGLK